MKSRPDAVEVAKRLADLRARYRPESVEDARVRLRRERPFNPTSFAIDVQRRLGELRALCELAAHLQRR